MKHPAKQREEARRASDPGQGRRYRGGHRCSQCGAAISAGREGRRCQACRDTPSPVEAAVASLQLEAA